MFFSREISRSLARALMSIASEIISRVQPSCWRMLRHTSLSSGVVGQGTSLRTGAGPEGKTSSCKPCLGVRTLSRARGLRSLSSLSIGKKQTSSTAWRRELATRGRSTGLKSGYWQISIIWMRSRSRLRRCAPMASGLFIFTSRIPVEKIQGLGLTTMSVSLVISKRLATRERSQRNARSRTPR